MILFYRINYFVNAEVKRRDWSQKFEDCRKTAVKHQWLDSAGVKGDNGDATIGNIESIQKS